MKLSALLIDLSGTLHVGDVPTPRALSALLKLRRSSLPFRFCSNTSKESRRSLLGRLRAMGFDLREDELVTSLSACRTLVDKEKLKPFLLLSESAMEDFQEHSEYGDEEYDSVVVGLAPERLDYAHLDKAFRILSREPVEAGCASPEKDAPRSLIATHEAMYYRPSGISSPLSLGPGAFVHGLSVASSLPARVVGKPSRAFFELTLSTLGMRVGEGDVGIVGDDVKNDLGGGAVELGLKRFLVRTGKYRDGDEARAEEAGGPPLDGAFDTFADLVDVLCSE